jgi:AAA+ ATPase superfamily predicted ATPase
MHIISIASPDRISIRTFISYIKFSKGEHYKDIKLHYLMTSENIEQVLKEISEGPDDDYIVSYYLKNRARALDRVPKKLKEISDLLVFIDVYSMDWNILKDLKEEGVSLKVRWDMNMKKMLGG